jgi:hypothetical protein
LEIVAEETDIYYDEISSGLLVQEIRRNRQEFFESLKIYHRVFVQGESIEELLKEVEE